MTNIINKLKSLNIYPTGKDLDKKDLILTQKHLKVQKNITIPKDFITFLQNYNGFNFMGGHIYGIYNKDHLINNIIYQNNIFQKTDCIFLGHNEFDHLVFNNSSNKYQILDKDDLEVLEEYVDFEDGFFYIIKL